MAICSNCGAQVEGTFCGVCGRPVDGASGAAPGAAAPGAAPPGIPIDQAKGFLGSLFDFSFTHFITSKLIKVLYGLAIAGAGLMTIFAIGGAFNSSTIAGVLMLLIGGPLLFLLYVILARVWLEVLIVIFRISEYTAEIAERGRTSASR